MHKYMMDPQDTQKINDIQDTSSPCRVLYKNPAQVFGEHGPEEEYIHEDDGYMNALLSLILKNSKDNHTEQDSTKNSQVVMEDESFPGMDLMEWVFNSEPITVGAENLVQSTEPGSSSRDPYECYDFSRGDFLELDDIIDPELPTSSLGNSIDGPLTSPEDFNLLAMLQNMEDENNSDTSIKPSIDCKLSISTTLKANQVVIKPPPSVPLPNSNKESASPATMLESVPGLFQSHRGSGLELPLVKNAPRCMNGTNHGSKKTTKGPLHNSTKESASPVTMLKRLRELFLSHPGCGLDLPLVKKASKCMNETSQGSKKTVQERLFFNGIAKWVRNFIFP